MSPIPMNMVKKAISHNSNQINIGATNKPKEKHAMLLIL